MGQSISCLVFHKRLHKAGRKITYSKRQIGTFPYLGNEGLGALSLLGTAIYIYSFETQRVCWANRAALGLWNAGSEQELFDRELTPYSQSTALRLDEYLAAFRRGEDRLETWTLYPRGEARSFLCRCSGVSLDGHAQAMLVETGVETTPTVTGAELRAIEGLRHTPLKITLFSETGEVLMRNPAALAQFAQFDRSLPPGADHLRAMFVNEADCDALIDAARREPVGRAQATMRLPGLPVHNIHLSLVTDPVTGGSARLVAQDDVSLLVRTQRQLAASEDALDAVLNLDVTPVVVLAAPDGRVLNTNLSAREVLDERLSIGSPVAALLANPDDYGRLRDAALAGQASAAPMQVRARGGKTFWASVSAARISYDKQDAIVLLLANIDALYRAAADLEAALSSERNITAMQRRFLAIASHEFRTPLAVIDSAAQRLERNAAQLTPDEVRGRAGRIRSTVARLLRLLDNTLERARNNQGVLGYAPELSDLGALIDHAAAALRESHPEFGIAVNLPPLPPLNLDGTLIEQAITNLLANALKYAADEKRAEVTAVVTSADVQLFIRDWGIGVPAAEQDRIFADYVRGSNVGSTPGTGLGLSIVRQIVGLHGGTIEAVQTDGPGLTIKITLPRP